MKKLLALVGLTTVALGCHSEPPRELLDARAAYQRAQQNPGARLAAVDMHEARVALSSAEKTFDDDGDGQEAKDSAYIAQRRAVGANAKANALQSLEQKKLAELDLVKLKESTSVAMRAELSTTKGELTNAQSQAESERRARSEADRRAQDALEKIAGLKSQQSDRGLVLTLSGSVLFATNKSELLASAQGRLSEVARALKEDQRSITIVGHTDSQGADEYNAKLSLARAESVKNYLTSQGVPSDRIRAEGMGETQPIADNQSADGRANNRRVEIVLARSPDGSASPAAGTSSP